VPGAQDVHVNKGLIGAALGVVATGAAVGLGGRALRGRPDPPAPGPGRRPSRSSRCPPTGPAAS
jgi:hypothetical protein